MSYLHCPMGQIQHGGFGHPKRLAMPSWKMPAWDSDFSLCFGMNDSLGFSFPFTPFWGIFGQVFFVLVGSSGSDFGAINEGHEEKLDFAGKLGEGGATAQTQPLSLPSDWGGFPIHI